MVKKKRSYRTVFVTRHGPNGAPTPKSETSRRSLGKIMLSGRAVDVQTLPSCADSLIVIDPAALALQHETWPSIAQILNEGTPAEIRESLRTMGGMLWGGNMLTEAEYIWLGKALAAIGNGEDANTAFRLNNKRRFGVRQIMSLDFIVNELSRKNGLVGLSRKKAMDLLRPSDIRSRENSLSKLLGRHRKK